MLSRKTIPKSYSTSKLIVHFVRFLLPKTAGPNVIESVTLNSVLTAWNFVLTEPAKKFCSFLVLSIKT